MSVFDYRRGPYGTNEGDSWLGSDELRRRVKADKGEGFEVVIEVMRDRGSGRLEERIYVTEVPELVERATAGVELYWQAKAEQN